MRWKVNLGVTVTFRGGLTWVVAQRTRLEGTPSHPGHPGNHDLFLEPSGLGLFVLIDLTLESLDLACPFSETDRVRLGYIVCPSTSCSIHEEAERGVVRAVADGGQTSDFPHVPNKGTRWRLTVFVLSRYSVSPWPLTLLRCTLCRCSSLTKTVLQLPATSEYAKIGSVLLIRFS